MTLINDLPDDCFRNIFHRLSLSDRMGLHRVCHRWGSLQPNVTEKVKSLTLNIAITERKSKVFHEISPMTIRYLDRIDPSSKSLFNASPSLTFLNLTENITNQLIALLPNIESLQLNIKLTETTDVAFVNQLLSCWSEKLITFEFNGLRYDPIEDQFYSPSGITVRKTQFVEFTDRLEEDFDIQTLFNMFRVLNHECFKLQNLSFYAEELLSLGGEIDLSCLKRLSTFRFNSLDQFDELFDSLRLYAALNEKLYKIHIENPMSNECLIAFQNGHVRYPNLFPKFTSLPDIDPTRTFLSKFTNLTRLSMDLKDFLDMTFELAKLDNLASLSLRTSLDTIQTYEETHPLTEFAQLQSVKILRLSGPTYTDLQFDEWAWIFPSIQLVKFKLKAEIKNPQDMIWIDEVKHILEPLKQCSTLKWVIMTVYDIYRCKVLSTVTKELDIEKL